MFVFGELVLSLVSDRGWFFVVALVFTHSVIVENYFLFRIFTLRSQREIIIIVPFWLRLLWGFDDENVLAVTLQYVNILLMCSYRILSRELSRTVC